MNEFFLIMPLPLNFIFFIIGIAVLLKGSDFFIDGSVYYAKKFNISEVIIGLTIISIGTSLPELATNINAVLKARGTIAIGNIVGSNISNIAFIVGLSAIICKRISVPGKIISRDVYMMLGSGILIAVFSYFFDPGEFKINNIEAMILVVLFIVYMIYLFKFDKNEDIAQEINDPKLKSTLTATAFLVLGLLSIFAGSEIMIRNIIAISDKLQLNDSIAGATIVALATSFPELAVTLIAIKKNNTGISIGNIVGSNTINIVLVLGLTGLIGDIKIVDHLDNVDYKMLFFMLPFMLLITLLFYFFIKIKKSFSRLSGIILVSLYILFIVINYIKL